MMESNDTSKFRRSNADGEEVVHGRGRRGGSGLNASLILFVLVVAGAVTFFFQNTNPAKISFLFFDWQTVVRWAIVAAIVVGILLDRLISVWWRRRRR